MALQTEPRTRAALLALPNDGCRHELIDGEHIVTPAPTPRHQLVLMRLVDQLLSHVRVHQLGQLFNVAADLSFGEDELLQPDIFLTSAMAKAPSSWEAIPLPRLVVEIVSPSSARTDRIAKRLRYQRAGVTDYWVVDAEQQQVEVWHPHAETGEIWQERLVWPVPESAPLIIDLNSIFA